MFARLFSQIHLDSDLQSSSLEGGKLQNMANYLFGLIEPFNTEYKTTLPADFEQALSQLTRDPFRTIIAREELSLRYQEMRESRAEPEEIHQALLQQVHDDRLFTSVTEEVRELAHG